MKYVLFYDCVDDVLDRAPTYFPDHNAHIEEFTCRGLLMVGPFADPQEHGSMTIFETREAAEEFAREDPFVRNGVVRDWHILEWYETITGS